MRTTESWQTRLIGASVFAASCGFSFNVQAERPHYRAELRAPSHLVTCNDADGFRDVLSLALPEPLLEPPITRVLEVRVDRLPKGGFVADVTTKELDGSAVATMHETYPGETECFKVLHKVAVATSIWLNKLDGPLDRAPTPAPQTPPVPQCPACAPPPPPPQCPAPPTNPPVPEPRKLRNVYVGAGPQIALGIAPEIVAGGQLVSGWRWARSWSAELNVGATFPRNTRPWGPTVVHVYTALSVGAAPCYRIGSFGVCGLVEWSRLWFQRRGLASYEDHANDALRFGLRGFMEQRLTERLSLRVDLDIAAPVQRSSIRDDVKRIRWEMPHVTGNFNAALVAWF